MCCQRCEIFSAQAVPTPSPFLRPRQTFLFPSTSSSLSLYLACLLSALLCAVFVFSNTRPDTRIHAQRPKNRTLHTIQNRAAVVHPLFIHSAPRRARASCPVLSSAGRLSSPSDPCAWSVYIYIWQKRDADTSDLRLRM